MAAGSRSRTARSARSRSPRPGSNARNPARRVWPSAWVRPLGDWGPGRVELLQLPTPDETHDNVAAYWVPAQLPAGDAESLMSFLEDRRRAGGTPR